MFPDRSADIPYFRNKATSCWKRGDFDSARKAFFAFVEFVNQQNVNTGGALESEHREAKDLYSRFAAEDPLYHRLLAEGIRVIAAKPGLLQAELYGLMQAASRDDLAYVLYFAAEHGRIVRAKKGRTYQLFVPPGAMGPAS
jgi:hypothetical protein